jgi:hypothetical protein
MSSTKRKMLDTSAVPQKLNQFREFNQGAYETCDAKAYAEYIAQDVSLSICSLFSLIII